MCGILGIINVANDRPVRPEVLQSMADTMRHRGPDDAGVWIDETGQCGFGHRRLSIMDLSSAGHQPMGTPDGEVWVTFNGEIYNYPELRKKLEARGFSFRSQCDTEAILYLYEVFGERFYEELDGDFAIGLWDRRRRRLILCRDRMGVKPVYYGYHDGRLIFASEIKALLKYPGFAADIDRKAFYHYLTYLVAPPPSTLVEGVYKLEAGSSLHLLPEQGYQPLVSKYWEPFPRVSEYSSFEERDERLAELYSASVRKRLMADVPVGVLFSGGVDSSLNLGAFSELIAPERVKTFTVGMDNGGDFADESGRARRMADELGSEHHEVRITEKDLLDATTNLARQQDEPVSDPVSVPLYFVTQLARECGVTVLHAGEGADEIFCGYRSYRKYLDLERRLWRPLAYMPRWLRKMASSAIARSHHPSALKVSDIIDRSIAGQEFFLSAAVAYYDREKTSILSRAYREDISALDSFGIVAPYYRRLREHYPDATLLQAITYIELQLRLPELLLMRADKMSMANSVEVRVPFLDRDLVDFALSCPQAYKLRGGISKEPLKKLATRYVAANELYRPKTGFGVPIKEWFRGRLGEALDDLLTSAGSERDLFDVNQIRRRIRIGPRTVNEAFHLWVIFNLLSWKETL